MFVGYMQYGDRELFNNNRLDAYANSLVRTLNVRACDTCDSLDTDYDSPITDPAPWYSASDPLSADFVGILPLDVEGLEGDVRQAETAQRHGDGGYISRVRRPIREVRVTALLIANSSPGLEYGMDWLRGTLNAGLRGPVFGAEAAFSAPDFIDINSQCNDDKRDLMFYEACPQGTATEDKMYRVLRGAACVDGPTPIQKIERSSGYMYRVEFTMASGDPFVYSKESDAALPNIASGDMPDYVCTAPAPLTTITDPTCPPLPAPPRPPVIPACYSSDTRNQRVGWYIPGTDISLTKPTYPVLTVDANVEVSNLWYRIWPLAVGESDAGALNACDTVGNMIVGNTAAGVVLEVDSSIRRATSTIAISGQSFDVDTTHLLYPPESVPAVDGDPFEPLSLEWPVMYGGGEGYIVYLEGASASALQATLTLVERR
jgi:hypothetical protein